jgi:hypothetical protein
MYSRKFNTKIGIIALESKEQLAARVPMPDAEGKAFVDGIYACLQRLYAKPIGHILIDEIEAAQKPVVIYCASKDNKDGSAASPHPPTLDNEMARFVKLRQLPQPALKAAQKQDPTFVPRDQAHYAAMVHSAIERSKMNRDIIARLCGMKREDLDAIELGRRPMLPEQYHRFAMVLYDHLDPGDGSVVGLRIDPEQTTDAAPDHIILGHELIHVWRMAKGMRVFEGGWEEEAMTTGLPPFICMKFTENKLRAEHGLALRTSYTAVCKTAYYKQMSFMVGGKMAEKGIAPEHQVAWFKWQSENPKLADQKLQIGKKSTFSGPQYHTWNK